ncbi:MAG TPA: MarC family protein [Kiritimatiellia bacterium]|nr:MarC family protein [Kiritimatiellia bacterium]HPS06752.1 MarC family protein [Kiritimatiellia bacterium]
MKEFWLCFVPLFVAVDAIGVLPLFVSMTEGLPADRLRKVVAQSVVTAATVALAFLLFGPLLLRFMGITVADFMIAGGLLLLVIALNDLLSGGKRRRLLEQADLGAVPIGVPLITGPGVLTTCLLLVGLHGRTLTASAVVVNIALAGLIFAFSGRITRAIGLSGTRTVSKVASLLLAAIAVMLIRKGIAEILKMF